MRTTCVCSRTVCARSQQAAQLHKRTSPLFCSRYQVCHLIFLPRPVLHAAQSALSCILLCLHLVAGKPGLYAKKANCKLWQMLGRLWMSRLGCRKHRHPADSGLRYHLFNRVHLSAALILSITPDSLLVASQDHALQALRTAAENFRNPVFPCALIAGDVVILNLLSRLGLLDNGRVKVLFLTPSTCLRRPTHSSTSLR